MMAAHRPMDDTTLLARLRAQVEFYFSPQNLARDTFLRSILEQNDNAVPVETIATFPKIRQLHAIGRWGMVNVPRNSLPPADPILLCRALEGSHVVTVSNDSKWIQLMSDGANDTALHERSNATPNQEHPFGGSDTNKSPPSSPSSQTTAASSAGVPTHPVPVKERTTLIVWEAPESCTADEMMQLFSCNTFRPKFVQHDTRNTWFITFHSENEVVAALAASSRKTLRGMTIHAGIKTEGPAPPPPPPPPPPPRSVPLPLHYAYPHPGMIQQGYPALYDPYYGTAAMPQHYYGVGYAPPVQYTGMYPSSYSEPGGRLPSPHIVSQAPPYAGYVPHQQQSDIRQQQYNKRNYSKKGKKGSRDGRNRQNSYDRIHDSNRSHQTSYDHHDYDSNRSGQNSDDCGNGVECTRPNVSERHVKDQESNSKQKSSETGDNTGSPLSSSDGSYKKKKMNANKNKQKRKGTNEMFDQNHFPALVENGSLAGAKVVDAPKAAGYAAALKKQPELLPSGESTSAPRSNQTPTGESTSQKKTGLEQHMSKLDVSSGPQKEQEFWKVDEPVPEVW